MTIHNPKTKEEWLALRHKYVSSTESCALKGLSPYLTKFELYYAKKETSPTQFESNERMEWGLRMEESIARAIADVYGVKVRKLNSYVSRDGTGMGASFDYEIVGVKEDITPEDTCLQGMYKDLGPGILEIKNVDWLVFKRSWTRDGETFEAPAHIELQVQHQLHVIERAWAAIGVLVGGNSLKLLIRERDPEVGQILEDATKAFWKDVKADRVPPVVLPQDSGMIAHLYNYATPDKVLDAQGDSPEAQEVTALCKEYDDAGILKKAAEDRQKTAKAKLLMLIGDAERVIAGDNYTISAGMVAEAEIPAYTRKAYRNVRITLKKGK